MKVTEVRGLARQMLERTVIPLDQRGAVDGDEIAEHETGADEVFHGFRPNFLRK